MSSENVPIPEKSIGTIIVPKLPTVVSKSGRIVGKRPTKEEKEKYEEDLVSFAEKMQEAQNLISRKVSARGWCYILEGMRVINKGQFDSVETAINDCRKEGLLPLEFVATDDNRKFHHVEDIEVETEDPRDYLISWLKALERVDEIKDDIAYWQNQKYYIEMMVEKIDLLNLFSDTCKKYHISIANAKGWSDLISRGKLAERFKEAEKLGLKCVLLYFGDFDIGGLQIADQLRSNIQDIEKATHFDPSNLIIDHFGLSLDQIKQLNLTWIDGKDFVSGSGKAPDETKRHVQDYITKYGRRKCEANAILFRENEAIAILETTIKKYLDNPFEVYDKAKKEAQKAVKAIMDEEKIKEKVREWIELLEASHPEVEEKLAENSKSRDFQQESDPDEDSEPIVAGEIITLPDGEWPPKGPPNGDIPIERTQRGPIQFLPDNRMLIWGSPDLIRICVKCKKEYPSSGEVDPCQCGGRTFKFLPTLDKKKKDEEDSTFFLKDDERRDFDDELDEG